MIIRDNVLIGGGVQRAWRSVKDLGGPTAVNNYRFISDVALDFS